MYNKLSRILSSMLTLILCIMIYDYHHATYHEIHLFHFPLFIAVPAFIACLFFLLLVLPLYYLAIHIYLQQQQCYIYFSATKQPILEGFVDIIMKAIIRPLCKLYIIEESGIFNTLLNL